MNDRNGWIKGVARGAADSRPAHLKQLQSDPLPPPPYPVNG